MKRTTFAAFAFALLTASGSSLAGQGKEGLYFIADTGSSTIRDAGGLLGRADRDEDDSIYSLGLGKEFGNNFFAEAVYTKLLDIDFTEGAVVGTTETSAFSGRIGKIFPWNEHVAFTTHLGAAYLSSETEWNDGATSGELDEDAMTALAGVGMNLSITQNLDARVRFERIIGVDTGGAGDFDLDNLTAGVAYHW